MPVDTLHPDYEANAAKWKRCLASIEGQDAIHEGRETYLPRLSGQDDAQYKAYLGRALFYNAVGRTLDGMTGLIFRKEPQVTLPAGLEFAQEDMDKAGTSLLGFSETIVDHIMSVGRVGVLVDYPKTDVPVTTVGEAQSLGLRPYASIYSALAIINWEAGAYDQLNKVVLAEHISSIDPKDEFKTVVTPQWRVLDLFEGKYRVRIIQKDEHKKDVLIDEYYPMMNNQPLKFIPFYIYSAIGKSVSIKKPPLIDMVDVNLSHYKTTADYEHGLHFTGLPTPVVTGYDVKTNDKGIPTETLSIGSSTAWVFPSKDAKASYLEFTGQGLQQLSKALEEKEAKLASLGARMLAPEKRMAEAAETAAINRSGENSVLASIAYAASELLEEVMQVISQWAGVSGNIEIHLNTDYLPVGMTAQDLAELVKAWQAGGISFETMHYNLVRGEIMPADVTAEEEQEKIAEQPPLGMTDGAE